MTTKTNKEWEKEIPESKVREWTHRWEKGFKEIIRQELSSERQRLREEIEGMKKEKVSNEDL